MLIFFLLQTNKISDDRVCKPHQYTALNKWWAIPNVGVSRADKYRWKLDWFAKHELEVAGWKINLHRQDLYPIEPAFHLRLRAYLTNLDFVLEIIKHHYY